MYRKPNIEDQTQVADEFSKEVLIEETIPVKKLLYILGLKDIRTVDVILEKASIKIVVQGDEPFVQTQDVIKHLGVTKLPEKFLDVKGVMKKFSLTELQVRKYARDGIIPSYTYQSDNRDKKSPRYLFVEEEIKDAINNFPHVNFEIEYSPKFLTTAWKIREYEKLFVKMIERISTHINLSYRETEILRMVFIHSKGYSETGEHFGLTSERVRQIYEKAFKKCTFFIQRSLETWEEEKLLRNANSDLERRNKYLQKKLAEFESIMSDKEKGKIKNDTIENPIFNLSLLELDLSVRCLNCLKAAEIKTLGDLAEFSESALLKFRNFGRRSLVELKKLLESKGLAFREESE